MSPEGYQKVVFFDFIIFLVRSRYLTVQSAPYNKNIVFYKNTLMLNCIALKEHPNGSMNSLGFFGSF